MYDIITIGDITIDVFIEPEEVTVLCDVLKDRCQLCFSYADKIPVKSKHKVVAVGNAANLAVGASRLGLKTAIYTNIGNDDDGQECLGKLKAEGVSTEYVVTDDRRGTNYSTVINVKGERTILVYHEDRDYKLPPITKAKWVYFSSIADGEDDVQREILRYVAESGAKLGFNPGTYQMKKGLEKLKPVIAASHVLILNEEEGERLVGEQKDIPTLLRKLHEEGPKIVVITDGPDGSYAYDGNDMFYQTIYDQPVVERTGAGDSYSTGFIAALCCEDGNIEEAMRWGTFNSASVIQAIGAQEKLLHKEEMRAFLNEHPEIRPKKIS